MAKSKKLDKKSNSKHHGISLCKLSSSCLKAFKDLQPSEKKEFENTLCSVCIEFPHNAVLLLCSSYEKGCRPYMCATSHRYSNCLDQYKKANNGNITSLLCPLCRGQVKGWTVVERARAYFNVKKRACTHDNCSFLGSYRDLKRHVKSAHPSARPRDVDPTRVEKWRRLENERALSDVLSTIRSTMPGAIVAGDYVIEMNSRRRDFYRSNDYFDTHLERRAVGSGRMGSGFFRGGPMAAMRRGRLRGQRCLSVG